MSEIHDIARRVIDGYYRLASNEYISFAAYHAKELSGQVLADAERVADLERLLWPGGRPGAECDCDGRRRWQCPNPPKECEGIEVKSTTVLYGYRDDFEEDELGGR